MGCSSLDALGIPEGGCGEVPDVGGYEPFYDYYQISRKDESDAGETEPGKEGELKSRWEGSHSPFGFIWSIAAATGWSVDYILHGVNYQTLMLMIADAPRYVEAQRKADGQSAEDEASDIVGFFQSQLK